MRTRSFQAWVTRYWWRWPLVHGATTLVVVATLDSFAYGASTASSLTLGVVLALIVVAFGAALEAVKYAWRFAKRFAS
jgi:hypothetical protein